MSFIQPISSAFQQIVAPTPVQLFPPIPFEERRRNPPGISVNITPNQNTNGALLLAGTNFVEGPIRVNSNNIIVKRAGRYIVDLNITVSYPIADSTGTANSAFFNIVPGYGTYITGGSSVGATKTTQQVYSGSTVIYVGEGGSISVVATLSGTTVQNGTLVVQMIPDTDRRHEY